MYFQGVKEKDKVYDLFNKMIMRVESIDRKNYFPIALRSLKGNYFSFCNMNGFDGVFKFQRYYWKKPKIVE